MFWTLLKSSSFFTLLLWYTFSNMKLRSSFMLILHSGLWRQLPFGRPIVKWWGWTLVAHSFLDEAEISMAGTNYRSGGKGMPSFSVPFSPFYCCPGPWLYSLVAKGMQPASLASIKWTVFLPCTWLCFYLGIMGKLRHLSFYAQEGYFTPPARFCICPKHSSLQDNVSLNTVSCKKVCLGCSFLQETVFKGTRFKPIC